jgi:hypothetical protein
MSRYTDYIPTKDGDFLIWVKKLFAGVSEHAAAWGIFETVPTDWEQLNHSAFSTRSKLKARKRN